MLSRSDINDLAWKWKCKLSPSMRQQIGEKTVSDYSTDLSLDETEKAPPPKDPTFGADAVVKTFYEGKGSNPPHYNWFDYPPRQLSKSATKAQDRVAIKIYKTKDMEKPVMSGKYALKYHSLDIQSPVLVEALKDIVKKEDVHLEVTETAQFQEPFKPLFFCYDAIVSMHKKEKEGTMLKEHSALLIRLMNDIFGDTKFKLRHLQLSGLVSYKLAWTFFPKDTTIYTFSTNCELLSKVVDTKYMSDDQGKAFAITTKLICFNGETFVWKTQEFKIPIFSGNRPITELPYYPLEFHKDKEAIKTRLMERGKRVLDYQGLAYCNYAGVAIYTDEEKIERHNVDSRVLIDVFGYNKHHLARGKREGKEPETQKYKVIDEDPWYPDIQIKPVVPEVEPINETVIETEEDHPITSSPQQRISEAIQKSNKEKMLKKGKELMFVSPMLSGYALKNKKWLSFFVDDIEPMVWNDEAYDHLVYDEQQKDLVLTFVENHKRTKTEMDDVIKGKGQGLTILLSGPPGTGKTLTAEAVADRTRRPLFYLQAEDLGINAASLGANIKNAFEMATEWDAVILLDEADVFMAQRTPTDIARNELVSIFLRELEYFRGIIFLTTNLYDTIDSAFRSRVNIHLLFNPLTPDARMLVWRKFLLRIPELKGKKDENVLGDTISEDDLKELSAWQLNGREIKNAIKMVHSWCDSKGYDMALVRLENGIKATAPHASKSGGSYPPSLYD